MRPLPRRIARFFGFLLPAILGGCFDFDATTAGGPLSDAGAGDVGGSDATVGVDGDVADTNVGPLPDGGTYCESLPPSAGVVFCDDFDKGSLGARWSTLNVTGGTLAETDASFVSPPNSLDETINRLQTGDPINVALRQQLNTVPSLPKTVLFGFSIEPLQIDPSPQGAVVLAALDFLDDAMPSSNRYSIELSINVQNAAAAMVLAEQTGFSDGGTGAYLSHPLTQPLAMNAWTDLLITITWKAPTTAQASVSMKGVTLLTPVALTMTVQATHLQVGIGTSYVNEPSPGWELRYDNVSLAMQ
jgi:hypothetical protein